MSNPAAEPKPVDDVQGDGRWMSLHEAFLRDGKEKEPEVVLIGDSLVAKLSQSLLWQQMFEPLHSLNFGIGGDRTENVLWRVVNGEFDLVQPKVIVLLVGTNNYDDSADQVTEGILAIVRAIQEKQPASNLIVVGLLPRGEKPNPLREKHSAINKRLAEELQDIPLVTFLKIEDKEFMTGDGIIRRSVMYDFLNLTVDLGYQKLCEPLLEEIQNLLGTFIKVESTSFETSSIGGDIAGN